MVVYLVVTLVIISYMTVPCIGHSCELIHKSLHVCAGLKTFAVDQQVHIVTDQIKLLHILTNNASISEPIQMHSTGQ